MRLGPGLTPTDSRSTVWCRRVTVTEFRRTSVMPVYEFKCSKCGDLFEVMGSYAEREKEHACPKCGSTEVKQAISLFSAAPPSSF
jgi:putative FmdB family regulatory protein